MSRSIGRLLVLLALWVQILAPVAAVQAVMAADDPLAGMTAGMTICGHVADGSADAGDSHAMAPLCGLCCAAIAVLDTPAPSAVAVELTWTTQVFAPPADASARAARPCLTRVRDPPALA